MTHWTAVHKETRDGFEIAVSFGEEDMAPDWDMSAEERADLLDKIERGVLLWFVARIEARKAGVTLGTAYLGGCCYESVADFLRCDYYAELVREATDEARATLEVLAA